jgi:DNA-binding SARP family transcriptional activator
VEYENSSPDISKNKNEPSNHYISIYPKELNTQQQDPLSVVSEIVHTPTNIDANISLLISSGEDPSPIVPPVQEVQDKFQLSFYCLGPFRVLQKGNLIENLPNRKALAILKYLVTHRQSPIPKDVLMNIFWPDADPVSARNRLNVAMHGLRREFRSITDVPIVLFEGDGYLINPAAELWVDTEEFERHFKSANQLEATGQNSAAVEEFEVATSLYSDDFLIEDLYEEWPIIIRERLRIEYLEILDHLSRIYFDQGQYTVCISLCSRILERDNCREDAHCRLMRCYSRLGQPYLALRQYQICVDALRSELDVDPDMATTKLADRIRRHERV